MTTKQRAQNHYNGPFARWQGLTRAMAVEARPSGDWHPSELPEPIAIMLDRMAAEDPSLVEIFAQFPPLDATIPWWFTAETEAERVARYDEIDRKVAARREQLDIALDWLLTVLEEHPRAIPVLRERLGCCECCYAE